VQVGARSVLLEGSMMEDYSVLQPGSVLPPTRRVPTGARQQQCSGHLHSLVSSAIHGQYLWRS
jgi:carbonic anhydrase/acetyltransferase-like protein (isoleucine patch superfamily)